MDPDVKPPASKKGKTWYQKNVGTGMSIKSQLKQRLGLSPAGKKLTAPREAEDALDPSASRSVAAPAGGSGRSIGPLTSDSRTQSSPLPKFSGGQLRGSPEVDPLDLQPRVLFGGGLEGPPKAGPSQRPPLEPARLNTRKEAAQPARTHAVSWHVETDEAAGLCTSAQQGAHILRAGPSLERRHCETRPCSNEAAPTPWLLRNEKSVETPEVPRLHEADLGVDKKWYQRNLKQEIRKRLGWKSKKDRPPISFTDSDMMQTGNTISHSTSNSPRDNNDALPPHSESPGWGMKLAPKSVMAQREPKQRPGTVAEPGAANGASTQVAGPSTVSSSVPVINTLRCIDNNNINSMSVKETENNGVSKNGIGKNSHRRSPSVSNLPAGPTPPAPEGMVAGHVQRDGIQVDGTLTVPLEGQPSSLVPSPQSVDPQHPLPPRWSPPPGTDLHRRLSQAVALGAQGGLSRSGGSTCVSGRPARLRSPLTKLGPEDEAPPRQSREPGPQLQQGIQSMVQSDKDRLLAAVMHNIEEYRSSDQEEEDESNPQGSTLASSSADEDVPRYNNHHHLEHQRQHTTECGNAQGTSSHPPSKDGPIQAWSAVEIQNQQQEHVQNAAASRGVGEAVHGQRDTELLGHRLEELPVHSDAVVACADPPEDLRRPVEELEDSAASHLQDIEEDKEPTTDRLQAFKEDEMYSSHSSSSELSSAFDHGGGPHGTGGVIQSPGSLSARHRRHTEDLSASQDELFHAEPAVLTKANSAVGCLTDLQGGSAVREERCGSADDQDASRPQSYEAAAATSDSERDSDSEGAVEASPRPEPARATGTFHSRSPCIKDSPMSTQAQLATVTPPPTPWADLSPAGRRLAASGDDSGGRSPTASPSSSGRSESDEPHRVAVGEESWAAEATSAPKHVRSASASTSVHVRQPSVDSWVGNGKGKQHHSYPRVHRDRPPLEQAAEGQQDAGSRVVHRGRDNAKETSISTVNEEAREGLSESASTHVSSEVSNNTSQEASEEKGTCTKFESGSSSASSCASEDTDREAVGFKMHSSNSFLPSYASPVTWHTPLSLTASMSSVDDRGPTPHPGGGSSDGLSATHTRNQSQEASKLARSMSNRALLETRHVAACFLSEEDTQGGGQDQERTYMFPASKPQPAARDDGAHEMESPDAPERVEREEGFKEEDMVALEIRHSRTNPTPPRPRPALPLSWLTPNVEVEPEPEQLADSPPGTPAHAEDEDASLAVGRLVHPSPSMSPELKGLVKEALEALEAASEEETSIVQSWDTAHWQDISGDRRSDAPLALQVGNTKEHACALSPSPPRHQSLQSSCFAREAGSTSQHNPLFQELLDDEERTTDGSLHHPTTILKDGTPASTRVNPLYVDLADTPLQELSRSHRYSNCDLKLDSKSNTLGQDPRICHADLSSCELEVSRAEATNASSTMPQEALGSGPASPTGLGPARQDEVASTCPRVSNTATPIESPAAPYYFGSAGKLYKGQPESPRSQSDGYIVNDEELKKYKERATCAEAEVAMLREMMEGVAAHWRAALAQYRQEAHEHAAAQEVSRKVNDALQAEVLGLKEQLGDRDCNKGSTDTHGRERDLATQVARLQRELYVERVNRTHLERSLNHLRSALEGVLHST